MPTVTRTGSFQIGFRQGWSDWQKNLPALAGWAKSNGFDTLDIGRFDAENAKTLAAAGIKIGTADLLQFGEITHPDPGKRKDIITANIEYVKAAAALGAKIFFTIVGADATKNRSDNYRIAVESFTPIADAAAAAGAVIAFEGYPGQPPQLALLGTTPETVRALLKDVPRGMALNYDPSHLIRLGVDHVRFLQEFAPHVVHVHGKDTELFPESIYEFGLYQPSAFSPGHGFGEQAWRYTIPGHGIARWTQIFRILKGVGYHGAVSIELEDENYNGTEDGEKTGLLNAAAFLKTA